MYLTDLFPRTPLHWLYSSLLGYSLLQLKLIYFPRLTLTSLHECLKHVDDAHCKAISHDWLQAPQNSDPIIQLTKQEQKDLLEHYGRLE